MSTVEKIAKKVTKTSERTLFSRKSRAHKPEQCILNYA